MAFYFDIISLHLMQDLRLMVHIQIMSEVKLYMNNYI